MKCVKYLFFGLLLIFGVWFIANSVQPDAHWVLPPAGAFCLAFYTCKVLDNGDKPKAERKKKDD